MGARGRRRRGVALLFGGALALAVSLDRLEAPRARGEDAAPAPATTAPVTTAASASAPSPSPATLTIEFDAASALSDEPDHLLRHTWLGERAWFSGQVNLIFQGHPGFSADYSGPNSLHSRREEKLSEVTTLCFGARIFEWTELLCQAENAAGKGIGDALGLAGFTNLDVVRNPDLGAEPYLARLEVHQTIPLSDELVDNPAQGPLSIRSKVPARRLELRLGKMGLPDLLDLNSCGSDSHFQFTNWTTAQNGAWDYAADTRGYTYAATVEYQDDLFAARFAAATMPRVANGIDMEWRLENSHAENLELEVHGKTFGDRRGALRLLGFVNHARMGEYRPTLVRHFLGVDSQPDITTTRTAGRTKVGFGLNVEQELSETLRVFGRLGWNDGRNESFAYTEVDDTVEVGWDLRGDLWSRERDRFGFAFVSNGISSPHRRYLRYGGSGFLLGDGCLRYEREDVLECYYTVRLPFGISFGPLYQHIWNPGYNHDRGPVDAYGFRFHLEI